MGYLTGRVFRDPAGYTYREHRPGWYRRDGAPEDQQTEHPFKTLRRFLIAEWVERGTFIIEEDPV